MVFILDINLFFEKIDPFSKRTKTKASKLTFFPHPRMVLQQDSSIKLLNTIDEKLLLLEKFGLDYLIIQPFDETFQICWQKIL